MEQAFESISLEHSLNTGLIDNEQSIVSINSTGSANKLNNQTLLDNDDDSSVIDNQNQNKGKYAKPAITNNFSIGVNLDSVSLSPDCTIGTSGVSATVMGELLKYQLNDYLQEKLRERFSFFRRVSVENIMKWQSKEISEPLTKIGKELEGVVLQLFKNLLSYMGDRKSSKKPIEHAKKHLKLTLNASEEIKDEIYVQVLKQIKGHKDYEKGIRGWNFFAMLASSYIPSQKLFYSILNFLLFEIKNNSDQNIVKHANYVFLRLYRTSENKRKNSPSESELIHIENMKPISIPIYFFSDTSENANIESYTTVRELKTAVMEKLQFNINRIPYYCLYEICNKKDSVEERFLEDTERVCDMLSLWDKEIQNSTKNKEHVEFKIYIKIFLYYPYSETDVDTVTVVYTQSVYDVVNGKYHFSEEDIITLASLQLLVEFGTSQDNAYLSLQKNLEKYIPINQLNLNPGVYWVQKVMELYSGLKASSKLEAKLTYMEQIRGSPLWEAHQFVGKFSNKNVENPENLPEEVIIGIKPDGILIFDTERNELANYPYHIIANWGISATFFVIIVSKSEGNVVKYYFETNQTKIIQALLESYTNLIAGKSIVEIQNITGEYGKRFDILNTSRSRSGTNYSKSSSNISEN